MYIDIHLLVHVDVHVHVHVHVHVRKCASTMWTMFGMVIMITNQGKVKFTYRVAQTVANTIFK